MKLIEELDGLAACLELYDDELETIANTITALKEADRMRDELRALSIVLVQHLGGGSEWFAQIGDEYFVSAKAIGPELQRRKTDAHITKCALIRANRATLTDKGDGDALS